MREVNKLDMAVEQLEDALEAYFRARYHSATVLAGAAEQLFAGHLLKHEQTPAWANMRSAAAKIANGLTLESDVREKPITLNDIGTTMNRVYNNSKHAGSKDHLVAFEPRLEAQYVLDRAIANFDVLAGLQDYDLPEIPLAQRFVRESIEGTHGED